MWPKLLVTHYSNMIIQKDSAWTYKHIDNPTVVTKDKHKTKISISDIYRQLCQNLSLQFWNILASFKALAQQISIAFLVNSFYTLAPFAIKLIVETSNKTLWSFKELESLPVELVDNLYKFSHAVDRKKIFTDQFNYVVERGPEIYKMAMWKVSNSSLTANYRNYSTKED